MAARKPFDFGIVAICDGWTMHRNCFFEKTATGKAVFKNEKREERKAVKLVGGSAGKGRIFGHRACYDRLMQRLFR